MSRPATLTAAQVSALTALAIADGDEYLCDLLSSAVRTDSSGARQILEHSYSARKLAAIAAGLEASS